MDQAESANSTGAEDLLGNVAVNKEIKQESVEAAQVDVDESNNNGNGQHHQDDSHDRDGVNGDHDDYDNDDEDDNQVVNDDKSNDTRMKLSAYEAVIGANDQELAKRQYSVDDDDVDNDNSSPKTKRLASDPNNSKRAIPNNDANHFDKSSASMQNPQKTNERSSFDDRHNNNSNGAVINGTHDNGCEDACSLSLDGVVANEQGQEVNQIKQYNQSEEPEQVRKLFIGGLDYKTSEETLKVHFEKFGEVIDCVVMREPQSKRSRGFGFVIYANSSMVDKAQDARPHEVDGREVQSKRAISREDSGKPEAQATVKKVYLGGLSDDIEESELRDYFRRFGNIVNINIVAHKDTGKRRGFAFLEFTDYDPVDKIVLKKYHTIKDKRIEAKKAIPKVEMDARKRTDPRTTMASAMIALSGGPPLDAPNGRPRGLGGRNGAAAAAAAACLWDSPYGAGYPGSYSSQTALDGGYPSHYHSPTAHYGTSSWMMHQGAGQGAANGLYGGFRGSHGGASGGGVYGRNSYGGGQPGGGGWSSAIDYDGFPAAPQAGAGGGGGAGPMRLSYQHRGWAPYGAGSYGPPHRSRGYNP